MEKVVTDLNERRRKKQWKFERSMLRSLSIEKMRTDANQMLLSHLFGDVVSKMYLLDFCLDIGIDAYLLGSEYGKFGYDGETAEQAYLRCKDDVDLFIFQTANQFYVWFTLTEEEQEQIYEKSKNFIFKWWKEGFIEGEKKYRLRLH